MGRACRGEIGRLPSECCAFLAPLLDCGAIELVAKCFHCPLELHVADTILLSIDVSILPAVRFPTINTPHAMPHATWSRPASPDDIQHPLSASQSPCDGLAHGRSPATEHGLPGFALCWTNASEAPKQRPHQSRSALGARRHSTCSCCRPRRPARAPRKGCRMPRPCPCSSARSASSIARRQSTSAPSA